MSRRDTGTIITYPVPSVCPEISSAQPMFLVLTSRMRCCEHRGRKRNTVHPSMKGKEERLQQSKDKGISDEGD